MANTDTIQKRKGVLLKFLEAYRETIDWMYKDPAALKRYAEFAGVPEPVARGLQDEFYPKDMLSPEKIVDLRAIVKEALAERYLTKKLSRGQLGNLIQIPAPNQQVCDVASASCPLGFVAP